MAFHRPGALESCFPRTLIFLTICVDGGNLPLLLPPTNQQLQAISSLCGPETNKKVLSDAKQGSLVCLSQQPKTIAVSTHLSSNFYPLWGHIIIQ